VIASMESAGTPTHYVYSVSDSKAESDASLWALRQQGRHGVRKHRTVRVEHCTIQLWIVVEFLETPRVVEASS